MNSGTEERRLHLGVNHGVPSWRLATAVYSWGPKDLHPFHMQNTLTPSQGPLETHPLVILARSLEYCHLSQAWAQMRLTRCSFLCIVPYVPFSLSAGL